MANIRLAVGTNGQVLTARSSAASGLAWETPGGSTSAWTMKHKSADQTIQSDNTLSDDDTLFFTTTANAEYTIHIAFFWESGATPDFKWLIHHTGTTTRLIERYYSLLDSDAAANAVVTTETTVTASGSAASPQTNWVEVWVQLQVGASGGTFSLQWAQNTSTASDTTVKKGSYMEYAEC